MKSDNLTIVGISGTNGAGKDSVAHILEEHFNYLFVSMTDLLRNEAIRRNLPPDRQSTREISTEWRRKYGLAVLVDKAIDIYNKSDGDFAGLVVSSLRNPGEADKIHELRGRVIWVDANPRLRYDRLQANSDNRGAVRSVDDKKSFEQFIEDENKEMYKYSDDPATLSTIDVKRKADATLINETNNMHDLTNRVKELLIGS